MRKHAAGYISRLSRWKTPRRTRLSSMRCSATPRSLPRRAWQKDLGWTVAEAMWKARPVVASRIGGIQSQIVDGESGVLLDDPHDLAAFGEAITGLLLDPPRATKIGESARERVRETSTDKPPQPSRLSRDHRHRYRATRHSCRSVTRRSIRLLRFAFRRRSVRRGRLRRRRRSPATRTDTRESSAAARAHSG